MVNGPIVGHVAKYGEPGDGSVTTLAALPAANVDNFGLIIFTIAKNKSYYSSGTAWGPVSTGAQDLPGTCRDGVPSGGNPMAANWKSNVGTTTKWARVTTSYIECGQVASTPDTQKPVSGRQWEGFATKQAKITEDPANPGYLLIGG